MSQQKPPGRAGVTRWLYRWHRRVALAALCFVVIVGVTGIILNHATALSLDKVKIENPVILGFYNRTLGAGEAPDLYPLEPEGWLAAVGGTLYGPRGPITVLESLKGGVLTPNLIIAAGPRTILLISPDGAILESLDWGRDITRIGLHESGIVLETATGLLMCDEDFLSCHPAPRNGAIKWSVARKPQRAEMEALVKFYGGGHISLYRFLLDIHTLRVVGKLGPWVLDLAVIGLLFVSVTGLVMWLRRRGP